MLEFLSMDAYHPLIGITSRYEPGKTEFCLSRYYPEAVYDAGGIPLLIPLIDTPEYLDQTLRKLDGILFPGSATDVDPKFYGRRPAPQLGPVDPLRDSVDMYLAREALRMDVPILAVCYGFQMLNVHMGGSLVQDLPSLRPSKVVHERQNPSEPVPKHKVDLVRGSLFEALAGRTRVDVNSSHHQAIERLAADLMPVATSSDGIIEAAVHRFGGPVLAVQWHPEKSFKEDEFSRRLLVHFVKQCKEFSSRKKRQDP
ncbi:MAG: gamma-glutamyl-gamma-aminobutyrate hydrolase family protein [Acidobacteria bacterium]|nr:gamma-glutamyl-gamma-aminobutyrate hydrolase family protein [Acidobacteriota bacterium]